MRKHVLKSWLSLVLCLALLAAAALSTVSLAETAVETAPEAGTETVVLMTGTREEPVVLGEGKTVFLFQVVDMEANESWFEIHTDAEDLGTALLENGLVAGDATEEYGLFVSSVCGMEIPWDPDNPYFWALFVEDPEAEDGFKSADTGVSFIVPEAGKTYAFRATLATF